MHTILDETRNIIKLALPLMAAFLSQKGMQFIDTIMMGWIGTDALAAGSLGTSIYITVVVFCMGLLSAVGVFIAHARGAKNEEEIALTLSQGICIALMLSLPAMLIVWFSPTILSKMGEAPVIVHNTALLLHGLVWGVPGFLLFLVFREFVSAFSLTRIVMFVTLGAIPLTFIANYILIYGKLGCPAFGIAGIGYAGAFIEWFMFFCLLVYSQYHPQLRLHITLLNSNHPWFWIPAIHGRDDKKIDGRNDRRWLELLQVGFPSGVMSLLDSGMFLFAAILISYFSTNALAAHQITMLCVSTAYAIPFALSMAVALRVGHAIGSGEPLLAKKTAYISFVLGFICSVIIAFIVIFYPQPVLNIFLNQQTEHDQSIVALGITFLRIASILFCFDALQVIANGALKGLKDTTIPMILSLGCYWIVGASCAYYLSYHTSLEASGVWVGLTIGIFAAAVVLGLRFLRQIKLPLINH